MDVTEYPLPAALRGRLIVSCQAPPDDPLDDTGTLARLAVSALRGGAAGLRANGAEAIHVFRQKTDLPILGILKRYQHGEMCITPDFTSAQAISDAGSDVIALDCTIARPSFAEPWPTLITRIHRELRKPVLADIATFDEAVAAAQAGADAVATTLRGFTPQTASVHSVDWPLLDRLVQSLSVPVIVEGHIALPEEVRRAIDAGAFSVVVGSAITRPESITARFVKALL
ncbi:N-acetylmannosamine-6-phosphate 2-epimerase [Paracidobacterium acidisoli]|uniref:N-acylglucosamine-6-phosphate 2-epimerase n=1 Tax=Paracidobacterium acidisoli TaxID=2303751 RepID=A0A372INW7_9BACT|nr:putative N-acetylmannosamine-6-phosphate 2-epimerase [Paracidobacterium acidisoli]MBT9330950.1 putative N-acetylmannosamine-6-phosphate 2-epimerase [Paracidobacterium acidisoli]